MAITISGENNNDRITAQDGVIDTISGFNISGIITASSFTGDLTGDVTGNLTGNVTGNINNSTLLLQVGGTEKLRLNSDRVIIGQAISNNQPSYNTSTTFVTAHTNNPGAWNAIAIISGNSTGASFLKFGDRDDEDVSQIGHYNVDNSLRFYTNGGYERLRITSTGKVGIGTDSPQEELTIMSSTPALMLRDTDQPNSYTQVSNANQDMYFSANGASAHANFIFRSGNAGSFSERLRINSSGFVGVGTATVNRGPLEISRSDTSDVQIHMTNAKTGGGSGRGFTIFAGNVGHGDAGFVNRHSGGAIEFYTNQGGTLAERLRIDSSGRLIIGDAANRLVWGVNPALQVNGTEWDDTSIAIHNFGNNTRRPTLLFTKGRSGTLGDFGTPVNAGEGLGIIGWSAHDSTDAENLACYIQGISESAPTTNNQYGAITFSTVNGGVTAYERLRITKNGVTTVNTANLLDAFQVDYGGGFVLALDGAGNIKQYRANGTNGGLTIQTALTSGSWGSADAGFISFKPRGTQTFLVNPSGAAVYGDFSIQSSLAKMSMIDTDGGDFFQLRNDGGTFKIRNSTDGRDDISIANNLITLGGVMNITDNNSIFFGASQDIEIRHNATSSRNEIIGKNHNLRILTNGTLELQCFQSTNSTNGNVLTATYNGGTKLYYQNGERLATTNTGLTINNSLNFDSWLHISKNGTYAPSSVGHTAANHEGIFWHSAPQYSIYRTAGGWSGPNYQQLRIDWPTGIVVAGGHQYGASGCAFIDIANFKANSSRPWGATFSSTSTNNSSRLFFEGTNHTANRTFSIMSENGKLRISGGGNSSLYGNTGSTGTQLIYLSSTTATSWTSGSDIRLKENVTEIPNVLDKVKNYRCARFNFIGDDASDIQNIKFGFIAQDWVSDFPEVLTTSTQDADDPTDTTEYYGMQYTETIPVLLKAIQELNAKVETLEAKVATLEGS